MMRSRRDFLAAGAAGATALLAAKQIHAQAVTKTQVWVQLTTGGKAYLTSLHRCSRSDLLRMEIWPIDQPANSRAAARSCAAATKRRTTRGRRGRAAADGAG